MINIAKVRARSLRPVSIKAHQNFYNFCNEMQDMDILNFKCFQDFCLKHHYKIGNMALEDLKKTYYDLQILEMKKKIWTITENGKEIFKINNEKTYKLELSKKYYFYLPPFRRGILYLIYFPEELVNLKPMTYSKKIAVSKVTSRMIYDYLRWFGYIKTRTNTLNLNLIEIIKNKITVNDTSIEKFCLELWEIIGKDIKIIPEVAINYIKSHNGTTNELYDKLKILYWCYPELITLYTASKILPDKRGQKPLTINKRIFYYIEMKKPFQIDKTINFDPYQTKIFDKWN